MQRASVGSLVDWCVRRGWLSTATGSDQGVPDQVSPAEHETWSFQTAPHVPFGCLTGPPSTQRHGEQRGEGRKRGQKQGRESAQPTLVQ